VLRCLIMGAAGRDFHDFRTFFRSHPEFHVLAFTATQIPFIDARAFPRSLAGPGYDQDIPIYSEDRLPRLIAELDIEFVFFAYSDISHEEVMHKASVVEAAGASFVLLGPGHTELRSGKPVVALTATRTGAGKSPITQWLAKRLVEAGVRAVTIRHPMPYGNLSRQAVQRFASYEDFRRADCTIEEREEYEPYVRAGLVIFAGVDYAAILRAAEAEADVILWDGGNNDFPFIRPDLGIVVCDALRAGHETHYYPGETNLRRADVVVISKVSGARRAQLVALHDAVARLRPTAEVIEADLEVTLEDPERVRGKRAIIVEDGPTVTHGGMGYGAGWIAATRYLAHPVDPRPHAVGTIRETYARYPHLESILPAMGYSPEQIGELQETIVASGAEIVIDGSPADLSRLLDLRIPIANARYAFVQKNGPDLFELVMNRLSKRPA
jgi:predicted GTPase